MKKTRKVFVDSSVLIAAAISSKGAARDLIIEGLRGDLRLLVSYDVLEETERNLKAKAPNAVEAFLAFREILKAEIVNPTRTQVLVATEVVPAKDAPIKAAAVEADADFLATYDQKHLLSKKDEIRVHFGLNVSTPSEILEAL